jgi:ankyrin repeat protein
LQGTGLAALRAVLAGPDAARLLRSRGEGGATPLLVAAGAGRVDVLSALRSAGGDVRAVDGAGRGAAAYAARAGEAEALEWALGAGADAGGAATAGAGHAPLHEAVLGGSPACALALLAAGADGRARNRACFPLFFPRRPTLCAARSDVCNARERNRESNRQNHTPHPHNAQGRA